MECNNCGSSNISHDRSLAGKATCRDCGSQDISRKNVSTRTEISNGECDQSTKSMDEQMMEYRKKVNPENDPMLNFILTPSTFRNIVLISIMIPCIVIIYKFLIYPRAIMLREIVDVVRGQHCMDSTVGDRVCFKKDLTECNTKPVEFNNIKFYSCTSAGTIKSLTGVVENFSSINESEENDNFVLCSVNGNNIYSKASFTCLTARRYGLLRRLENNNHENGIIRPGWENF